MEQNNIGLRENWGAGLALPVTISSLISVDRCVTLL
jgi:hypothetical protein